MFAPLLILLPFLSHVWAHGSIDSKSTTPRIEQFTQPFSVVITPEGNYNDPFPGGTLIPSPVRRIAIINPVTDVQSNDMSCGNGADTSASEVASVPAGSFIQVDWRSGEPGVPVSLPLSSPQDRNLNRGCSVDSPVRNHPNVHGSVPQFCNTMRCNTSQMVQDCTRWSATRPHLGAERTQYAFFPPFYFHTS